MAQNIQDAYQKWANGDHMPFPGGTTGGNLNAKVWFCGIEWGGSDVCIKKSDIKDGVKDLFCQDKFWRCYMAPKFYISKSNKGEEVLKAKLDDKSNIEQARRIDERLVEINKNQKEELSDLIKNYFSALFNNELPSYQDQQKAQQEYRHEYIKRNGEDPYPWIDDMRRLHGKIAKIMFATIKNSTVLRNQLSVNNRKWDDYKCAKEYLLDRLFSSTGETFAINLFPLSIGSLSQEKWENSSCPWRQTISLNYLFLFFLLFIS